MFFWVIQSLLGRSLLGGLAATSLSACSPALIHIQSSFSQFSFFSPWQSELGAGGTYSALWSSGQGGGGSVVNDGYGNTTVCATTTGVLSTNFPFGAHGTQDAYVARFNNTGGLEWTIQIAGGAGTDTNTYGCFSDNSNDGGIYLAAYTNTDYHALGVQNLFGLAGAQNALLFKINSAGMASSAGTVVWASQISAGTGYTTGLNGGMPDSSGNLVLVGSVNGTFLPLGNTVSYSTFSTSGANSFVSKISGSNGGLAWNSNIGGGGSANTVLQSITLDSSQNAYVIGTTNGMTVSTPTTSGSSSGQDIFTFKLNSSNGLESWAIQFGDGTGNILGGHGTGSYNNGPSIQVDSSGNTYVWGNAFATTTPTLTALGNASFSSTGGTNLDNDLFVARISAAGILAWTDRIQCGSNCASQFAQGNMGNRGGVFFSGNTTYLTGSTSGNTNGTIRGAGLGGQSVFFMILNSGALSTNILYTAGSLASLYLQGAVQDSLGHTILEGQANNEASLGGYQYGSNGNNDVFLISLDSLGNQIWLSQLGGGGGNPTGASIQTNSMSLDGSRNILVAGTYSPGTTGNFTFGNTVYGTTGGTGYNDGLILQVSPSTGYLNWYEQLGAGSGNNINLNTVWDSGGGIYVLGGITASTGNVFGGVGNLYGVSGNTNLLLSGISTQGPVQP